MIKKWLYKICLKKAQSELNKFLKIFIASDIEIKAMLLIGTIQIRNKYLATEGIDLMKPAKALDQQPFIAKQFNNVIKKMQNDIMTPAF